MSFSSREIQYFSLARKIAPITEKTFFFTKRIFQKFKICDFPRVFAWVFWWKFARQPQSNIKNTFYSSIDLMALGVSSSFRCCKQAHHTEKVTPKRGLENLGRVLERVEHVLMVRIVVQFDRSDAGANLQVLLVSINSRIQKANIDRWVLL